MCDLQPLVLLQKNNQTHFVPEIHRKYFSFFEKYKVLTAHKLHIYELLKFVRKSVNKMHIDTYLNESFLLNPDQTIQKDL